MAQVTLKRSTCCRRVRSTLLMSLIVRSFTAHSNVLQPTVRVNSTPHTSHFLAPACTHFNVTSTLAQVWRAQRTFHSIPSSCAHDVLTLCDSPFHFLLSTFSPIGLFILLVSTFHDVVDKFPVHSLMRTLAPLPSTTLSEIIYGQNSGRNWEEMPS